MTDAGGVSVLPVPDVPGRPVRAVAAVLGTLGAAFLAVLWWRPGGPVVVVRLTDVATLLAAWSAAAACGLTARRSPLSLRPFWWLLASACAAWAVGETVWTWYEVVLAVSVPYPSWADVGYLAGTPLAVAAFVAHPAARHRRGSRAVPLLDGLAVAGALLFAGWTLVLGPLWESPGSARLGDLVAVAYPFGDIVVLVLIVVALPRLPAGNALATAVLLGALVAMALADATYTYLAQTDSYASGDLLDAGWFLAYLGIAAAALLDRGGAMLREPAPARPVLGAGPFVPVVVVLALIAVRGGHTLDDVEWVLALGLCLVVILRQVLTLPGRKAEARAVASRHRATPAAASRTSNLGELTLEILAAQAPAAQERVARVSSSAVLTLGAVAGVVAVWDVSLLIRR